MNVEKGLKFLRFLHTLVDIGLPNYELKIIKVLRAPLVSATNIWVATHVLKNAALELAR